MQQSHLNKETVEISNDVLIPVIFKMLDEGHTATLHLRGYSMRPFLEDNRDDALLTKPKEIKVGDPVLALTTRGYYVLHRVIKIDGDMITLLGDGNLSTEECTRENVGAAVIGFYRKGRKKMDLTTGKKWRIYSWIWMHLFPIRRILLGVYRRIWIPIFGFA